MINRKIFYKIYWNMQSLIAPSLKYSQFIYEDILHQNCNINLKWLDLGCGHHLLPSWRYEQEKNLINKSKILVGLDYDFGSLVKHRTILNRVRGDISFLPFLDNSFDLITSNMVFEHLKNPETQLFEIFRVLKPGGKLIFHTPNIFGYSTIMANLIPEPIKDKLVFWLQGRKEDDVFPAYYKINTIPKIKNLAKVVGFEVDKIKMVVSSAVLIMIPPIVFFELIWIRMLMLKKLRMLRTNIIVILRKPCQSQT